MTVRKTFISLIIIAVAVAILLVAGGLQATQVESQSDQAAQPTAEAPSVAAAIPDAAQATSAISALGSVEARAVVSLSFQTAGTVQGVYAQAGEYVEAGDVVADLDSADAWNSYHQAALNLESAQLSLDDLQAPPTDEELAVAQANLTSAQAGYSSAANSTSDTQIQQAQLKYQQAQAQVNALQEARAFMNGSEEEITLQEAKIGAASFNAEIARLQLEELQTPNSSSLWSASIRIQQAQLALDKLQAGATQEQLDNAQIAIDRAQVSVEAAQTALEQTQLVAPQSGTVTAVNIQAGDSVGQSTAAIEISDLSKLQMTVPVNELDIGRVAVGQSATVQLDALTGVDIPGVVEDVGWLSSTSSDGIVTYDVRIALDTGDPRVRLGMTGEVVIESEGT